MASLPRIITVDPNGTVAQQVRSAADLMDRLVIQVDVPDSADALDELKRAPCQAVISVWDLDDMKGWELAAEIRNISPETSVIVLADYDDKTLDDETIQASPFVYMQRPYDAVRFMRVLQAALDGEDVFAAANPLAAAPLTYDTPDLGPVPTIPSEKLNAASSSISRLNQEVNAQAILLLARDGTQVLEIGTMGTLNGAELAHLLKPAMLAHLQLRDILAGNATTLQFYDGDNYDIYVLSVGLNHFLCVIFDGDRGRRQLGLVNQYGRRVAEEIIALLGADAWAIQRPIQPEKPVENSRRRLREQIEREAERPELERARMDDEADPPPVPPAPKAEPIPELDLDALFGEDIDIDDTADFFDDIEELEELAKNDSNSGGRKLIDQDQARELGLLDN